MSDNTNKKKVKEHVHVTPRLIISYIVLAILTFLCLFFFYILIINSTRSHIQIQQGFSFLPGGHFQKNFLNVINDAKLPILTGLKNSLIVSTCAAVLSCYFSALTAYGLYAYDFKLKKAAVVFILLILVMPTQVSALGFIQLITKINLMDSLLPLFSSIWQRTGSILLHVFIYAEFPSNGTT